MMATIVRSTNRVLALLLVSLSTVSCGGGAAPRPAGVLHVSGSRLRARVTDAGGGARRFDGWYDTVLASPCTFRLAEDGVRRCIPMGDVTNYLPPYADPDCTMPVITYVSPTQEALFYSADAGTAPPAACGADVSTLATSAWSDTIVSAWRIGAPQPAPTVLYVRDASGACVARMPFPDITSIYPVEKVAPGEMVAVSNTRVEARGASLQVQIFDNDDHSSMVGWTFDAIHQQPCLMSWVVGVTDDFRCYGVGPSPFNATCPPTAAEGCDGEYLFKQFDYCSPAAFTQVGASSCDDIAASEMPILDSDLIGTGRVRLVVARASDDTRPLMVNPGIWNDSGRYKAGPFFDTERQLSCGAVPMDDGTVRCLTAEVLNADAYADPTCTTLIAGKWTADTCAAHGPTPTAQFAVMRVEGGAHFYGLGAEIPPGTAYFLNTSNDPPTCEAYALQYGGYELTPADASVFATLTTLTE
jgi:hypothetical protein